MNVWQRYKKLWKDDPFLAWLIILCSLAFLLILADTVVLMDLYEAARK